MIKVCQICSISFQPSSSKNTNKYCSRKCYGQSKRRYPKFVNCKTCGKPYLKRKPSSSKYCSKKCIQWNTIPLQQRLAAIKYTKTEKGCLIPDHAPYIDVDGSDTTLCRVIWMQVRGVICKGLRVQHACGSNYCCNVEHMYLAYSNTGFHKVLTQEEKIQIVQKYDAGTHTRRMLAIEYEVSLATIAKVINESKLKHVSTLETA